MEIEELHIKQIVTVLDTNNYKASYSEDSPFSARIKELTDYPTIWVESLNTGKKYELYPDQIRVDLPYNIFKIVESQIEKELNKGLIEANTNTKTYLPRN